MTEYASRHFIEGDRPLRRDIRLLGWQLRRLLRHHGGDELWQQLDRVRDLAERRRRGEPELQQHMASAFRRAGSSQLAQLSRAIGLFFDLANLAEDRHRVRVLRQRRKAGTERETIHGMVQRLETRGITREKSLQLLANLQIEPVLTAHPTEAKRRDVRQALGRLRRDLHRLDEANLSRAERQEALNRMQRDLALLWLSDPISPRKPTVLEELNRTLFAVRTLWNVVPRVAEDLGQAFALPSADGNRVSNWLRFGNWIGGDRDGNPYVTRAVTNKTLGKLRRSAVQRHRRECKKLMQRLTISARHAGLPKSLQQHIHAACRAWPELERKISHLHEDEWLVQWLTIIDQRLKHSRALPGRDGPSGYQNGEQLARDVDVIRQALVQAGHDELVEGPLQAWQTRIEVFGLHLARLDIRINAKQIRQAIEELLTLTGQQHTYAQMDESERERVLTELSADSVLDCMNRTELSAETADLFDTFVDLQTLAHYGGGEAIGQFILSMTHAASDVLALLMLLQVAGRASDATRSHAFDVVPLFETIDDLQRAEQMLNALLNNERYRAHVRHCDDRQTCMLGYSDSAKDGGYLASNWALYRTQQRLVTAAEGHGVSLTIFHGRGGAIGRGGGPAARAILSLPHDAVHGRLRLTEQGEVIAERYDDPAIAHRHLEQLTWATLLQSADPSPDQPAEAETFAQQLADCSMSHYRRLIQHEAFEWYMRNCTALPLIEELPLGSRPSRRSGSASFEDLRAIPFTFSWNQVRMPINAFFGLGHAFDQLDESQQHYTQTLYQHWPWFRAVIDNAELALARCEPELTRQYAELTNNTDAALEVWQMLRDEHDRAVQAVIHIKQQSQMLETVPWLDRTIRVRNPYVDLLNLIQVEFMARGQAPADQDDATVIDYGSRLTVQAIAAGLRNTG